MKKLSILLLFIILTIMLSFSFASAVIRPYHNPGLDAFITSASQYYSVTVDGEGEAFVSLRIDITNVDETELADMIIEIPYPNIQLYTVLQQGNYLQQECVSWSDNKCVEYGEGQTCTQYDINGNCQVYERPCLEYGKKCQKYRTLSAPSINGYHKLTVAPEQLADSVSLPLTFSSPLQEGERTSLIIVYKIPHAAEKKAGVFHFDFETVRIPLITKSTRVAVNTQSGLIMKGVRDEVNYKTDFSLMESSFSKMASGSVSDEMYSSYSNRISSARGLVKTTTYLDPHESYSVRGKYADSWGKLYWSRVVLIALIILIVLAIIWFTRSKLKNATRKSLTKSLTKKETKSTAHKGFTLPFLTGLYTSLSILGLWIVTLIILSLGNQFLRRSNFWDVLGPLFVVLAVIVSLALMIGIPIHMSKKHDAAIGVYTLLSILGWLFVFFIIAFIVAIFFTSAPVYLL